ncbi:uncharacterized protein LOC118444626 isoform X2 [Vespa mandarinia]|uniref:uncharacterized protein LOC118444626 isoform X2 n=1 Tax=Vespa mandarinia TaxID=7446 RepID=UPI0016091B86|nr:uncharacterized protein LOC118444626 isoform X2 [Vespa mandarinia]
MQEDTVLMTRARSKKSETLASPREMQLLYGRRRYKMMTIAWVLVILTMANEVKLNTVQSSSLNVNETLTNSENEVFDISTDDHPHRVSGKPSKFDIDINHVTMIDDKSSYQIESSNTENSTRSSIDEEESSSCEQDLCVGEKLSNLLDELYKVDEYNVTDSVQIIRSETNNKPKTKREFEKEFERRSDLLDELHRYAKEHVVRIKIDPNTITGRKGRTFFDAFGLKKLLLPLFFGIQIIKSVLLALFLPSIIGSIGNIVGKGVSSFAQSSQTVTAAPEENFEFKDNLDLYNDDYLTRQPVGTLPASTLYDENMMQSQKSPEISSRYSYVDPAYTHANTISDRYYMRHAAQGFTKKQDFKIFHEIPTSSLLLTNYDPFYSPLLSRLDAVFYRLGHTSEGCREYAVCAMYRSPARYAPYSNLVSAQLSRELNELRKPASDNPDVLRFFRYMKAAKDGQDGINCEDVYANCPTAREDQNLRQNQAMLATYQDIDKLVHARKL